MQYLNATLNFLSPWIDPAIMVRIIPGFVVAVLLLLLLRSETMSALRRTCRIAVWCWHFFWYGAFKEPQKTVSGKALVSGGPFGAAAAAAEASLTEQGLLPANLDVPITEQQEVAQVPVSYAVSTCGDTLSCYYDQHGLACQDIFCLLHLTPQRAAQLHNIMASRVAYTLACKN